MARTYSFDRAAARPMPPKRHRKPAPMVKPSPAVDKLIDQYVILRSKKKQLEDEIDEKRGPICGFADGARVQHSKREGRVLASVKLDGSNHVLLFIQKAQYKKLGRNGEALLRSEMGNQDFEHYFVRHRSIKITDAALNSAEILKAIEKALSPFTAAGYVAVEDNWVPNATYTAGRIFDKTVSKMHRVLVDKCGAPIPYKPSLFPAGDNPEEEW